MALTTLAKVKIHLGIGLDNTTEDERLTQFMVQCEAMVDAYLKRTLASTSYTSYLRGNGQTILVLPQRPVTAITSVHVSGDGYNGHGTGFTSADLLTLATDYDWTENGLLYRLGATWPLYYPPSGLLQGDQMFGIGNVKVVYTAGYTAATLPADIQFAIHQIITAMRMASKVGAPITHESLDYYSYSTAPDNAPGTKMIHAASKILGQYRTAVL